MIGQYVFLLLVLAASPARADEEQTMLDYLPRGRRPHDCPLLFSLLTRRDPHIRALARAAAESPTDPLRSDILADAVEEAGNADRARFIRVQTEMTRRLRGRLRETLPDQERNDLYALQTEAYGLLERGGGGWISRLRGVHYQFRDGRIHGTFVNARDYFDRPSGEDGELYRRNPHLRHLTLYSPSVNDLRRISGHEGFRRLTHLTLDWEGMWATPESGQIQRFLERQGSLRSLAVRSDGTDLGLDAVIAAPGLRLEAFEWTGNLGAAEAERLARSPVFRGLTSLRLAVALNDGLHGAPFAALFAGRRRYVGLKRFGVPESGLHDSDLARMTAHRFPDLESLDLTGNLVSHGAVRALVLRLTTLKHVDLDGSNLGESARAEIEEILSARRNAP